MLEIMRKRLNHIKNDMYEKIPQPSIIVLRIKYGNYMVILWKYEDHWCWTVELLFMHSSLPVGK